MSSYKFIAHKPLMVPYLIGPATPRVKTAALTIRATLMHGHGLEAEAEPETEV